MPAMLAQQNALKAQQPAVPQIGQVLAAGGRIIIVTSDGRMFALDAGTGAIMWGIRFTDGQVNHAQANDFLAVANVVEERSGALVVIDLHSGEMVRRISGRRGISFMNFALGADDRMVFTLTGQVGQVDLDSSAAPGVVNPEQRAGYPHFLGMSSPGQLVIWHDKYIALSDAGTQMRVGSLLTENQTQSSQAVLGTGARAGNRIVLRMTGSHLYAIGDSSICAYDLASMVGNQWTMPLEAQVTDAFIGRSNLIITGSNGANNKILIYSRQSTAHGESGRLDFAPNVTEPGDISAWQLVEDGIYYLSGDHELRFLRGAGQAD